MLTRHLHDDILTINPKSPYALTKTLFQRQTTPKSLGMFHSAASHTSQSPSVVCLRPLDYSRLISFNYPKQLYIHFLNMIINTPDIIMEEKSAKEVAEEVRVNPRKRFSVPTKYKRGGSVLLIAESIIDCNHIDDNNSETNFSFIIESEKEETELSANVRNEQPSFLTSEPMDPENLTDEQIQKLIESKMNKLDKFNTKLQKRDELAIMTKYNLSELDVNKFKRLQIRIKGWFAKRRFFKSLKTNQYIEHKKNFLNLKRCLDKFDTENKGSRSVKYYKSAVNF